MTNPAWHPLAAILGVKATETVISALEMEVTSSSVTNNIGQPGVRVYRTPLIKNIFTNTRQAVK